MAPDRPAGRAAATGRAEAAPPPRRLPPSVGALLVSLFAYGVLGYALTARPPERLPGWLDWSLPAFPHLIAAVNTAAMACLLLGWRAIRRGRVRVHRRLMVAAAVLISAFLVLYVTRVVFGGIKAFPGPPSVKAFVYLPVLTIHITLSILSVPLVAYNLLIGLGYELRNIRRTRHARVGRIAVVLWSVSLTLGIVVYLMLNVLY